MPGFQQKEMQHRDILALPAIGTVTDYGIVYIMKHTE